MKRIVLKHVAILFLAAFVLSNIVGCDGDKSYVCQGTVMYVTSDTYNGQSSVVIRGDDGSVFTVVIDEHGIPPVWPGMHGIFRYESVDDGHYHNFQTIKILS